MNRRGFTIVELIIVLTISVILLVLGVVNLRASQANGRDAERKADIETIALHLETYYKNGNTGSNLLGYPPTALTSTPTTYLLDLDPKSITAPGTGNTPASTFIAAVDGTILTSLSLHPTFNEYVYQPLQGDAGSSLCTAGLECRRFNLYYRQETDNTVYRVTSRNQ